MQLPQQIKDELISACTFSASRSGGPGGQNVNKVNTKIELRFNLNDSTIFSDTQKQRLGIKLKNRINSDGIIVLFESSERSQLKNKQNAIAKFLELIEKALTPTKRRVKTKPTLSSKLKRLDKKKQQSMKKQLRRNTRDM
ncbi:alternative ribosome rescue aminoacyl-tRNA hydrolase ArfB [uncultured Draconibacterium sp.]|uniref:alternative ribosome rescue aminoacyl-tRNA hydrolase ArfB n=1 Tax=uncultured Draconibacterium sp. TaxID=1573823 RepID=UPI002AA7909E|nr:alternative ribosome rescue aminoacyl-tRNA hydrolase ArfB [uncultured Draconibacterium sp.]